ncbi:cation diffusion facilitator family transporter [Tistrella mobilis]|jgi:cation diffusion facilitator family transporter|uniref:cation diffusion facilitator family transporter n=1 Tax=Tistrella mobilis TaxID=171437 RepID=UPI0035573EAB
MSNLSPAERARERAVAIAVLADLALCGPFVTVAIWSGSLTMIADGVRGTLLICVGLVSYATLRNINRRRTGNFEYGTAKLEQAVSILIAMMLVVAACFIIYKIATKVPAPSETGSAAYLATFFVTFNLFLNTAQMLSLRRAARDGASIIVVSQYRARIAKTIGSVVVVGCVALDQLAGDMMLSYWADIVGSTVVAVIMLTTTYGMLKEAMPDLLDRSLAEPMQMEINKVLAQFFDEYDDIIRVRSRRLGNGAEVEITLTFEGDRPFSQIADILDRMRAALTQALPGAQIVLVPQAAKHHVMA